MPVSTVATTDAFRKILILPNDVTIGAEIVGDTLTLVAGTGIDITTDTATDTITITNATTTTGGAVSVSEDISTIDNYITFVTDISADEAVHANSSLRFNAATGTLSSTIFSGSGASLTNLPAGNLSGTIPSAVLNNSTVYIGTTAIGLDRTSASLSLTGVNIDGSAGSATTAGSATSAGSATKATNLVGGNSTTLLGSMPYQTNTDTTTLLAPNTTATKKFLTMTGTGTNGAAPGWNTISAGDVPTLNQNTTGTAAGLSATLVNTSGGTGQSSAFVQYGIVYASSTTALTTSSALKFNGNVIVYEVDAALSGAGATQGTATALTKSINNVTTVAASTGVRLPAATAGMRIMIRNGGANDLSVYPDTGAAINSAGANNPVTLGVGAFAEYVAMTTTQWYFVTPVFA